MEAHAHHHDHEKVDNKRAPDMAVIANGVRLAGSPEHAFVVVERCCVALPPVVDKDSRLNRFFKGTPIADRSVVGPSNFEAFYAAIKANMMVNKRHAEAFRLVVECEGTKMQYLVESGTEKEECKVHGVWNDVITTTFMEEMGEPPGVERTLSIQEYIFEVMRLVEEQKFGLVAFAALGYRCRQVWEFYEKTECFEKNGWMGWKTFLSYVLGSKEYFESRASLFMDCIDFFHLFVECPNIVLVSNIGWAGFVEKLGMLRDKITLNLEEMECWHLGDYG